MPGVSDEQTITQPGGTGPQDLSRPEGPARLLLRFTRPYRRTALAVVLAVLVVTATGLLGPWLIGAIVRVIETGGETAPRDLGLIALALAVVYVLRSTATGAVFHFSHVVAFSTVRDMRDALQARLQTFSPAYFATRASGDIVSRIMRDTDEMEPLLADAVYGFVVSALVGLGVFVILMTISPLLAVLAVLPLPFALWGVWRLGRTAQTAFDREGKLFGETSALAQDQVAGMREIQIFNREAAERGRFGGISARLAAAQMRARTVMAGFTPVVEGAAGLSTAVVVLAGGRMALTGEIGVSDLVTFVLYIAAIYMPLHSIADAAEAFQKSLTSLGRIGEVLAHHPEVADPPDGIALPRATGEIRMEGVNFAYPGQSLVIAGIDLTVPAGTTLALVGATGAGKSTIANLIARFHDPTSGAVRLDGHDLRAIRLGDLRANIAMVLQDVFLFNDTIAENIRFGRPGATDAEVEAAARTARAHEFIAAMPQGYATVVGERGVRLSGGQKQRLSIARAVLKDAPVLILDEATSAVDTETERAIQESLSELMRGRTSVVIAHRLSTIREADQIAVLDGGSVIELGRHAALMARGGTYARLVAAQSGEDLLAS